MKKTFGINVISSACGILPHTIRTWENRYQIFSPDRSDGGQRRYGEEDLLKAKLIVTLIDQGHSISSLAKQSPNDLRTLLRLKNSDFLKTKKFSEDLSIKNLLKDLTEYNLDSVASEISHLRLSTGVKDFIFKVVLPVMQETEKLALKGKYSVSQEHIISTIVRNQLSQINLVNEGPVSDRVAIATPEGNLHELPILISDIICHANRISTWYLGAAHPADCLSETVNALNCKTIVMGVVSSDQWNYRRKIIPYLKKMDMFLKNRVKLILGGGFELELPNFKNLENIKFVKSFEEFDKMLLEIST